MPSFVASMEKEMVEFMHSTRGRHPLHTMAKLKRAVVHELAANYGLESQAFDAEPHRHIELFKQSFGRLTMPQPSLSKVLKDPRAASSSSLESMRGHPALVFVDIARGVTLRPLMSHCQSEYRVAWVREDEAVIAFNSKADMDATVDLVGGGDRDRYRVMVASDSYFDRILGQRDMLNTFNAPSSKVNVDEDGFATPMPSGRAKKASSEEADDDIANSDKANEKANPWDALQDSDEESESKNEAGSAQDTTWWDD